MRTVLKALPLFALAACGTAQPPPLQPGTQADRIVVVKSQRWLTAYAGEQELVTYFHIGFDGESTSAKRFEGDGRTPEGTYMLKRKARELGPPRSFRISYPSPADRAHAKARGRSAGGDILLRSSADFSRGSGLTTRPGDGSIILKEWEMQQLLTLVPDGTPIIIRP
ncbi:L,D-transpeptidase family protein [Sphingopyxis sp.]|uniref:L,D-transpeptidase family protein n=1 Tax=Sphingopyxis sp. TaxID=1908224 RepID=UPI002D796395|nr:L,D-transpeptidase family protein [Sphingopyxis sp.]HET6524002.1 L,D-transpeptidase family protein [Sphingopyxis sp.]